MNDLIIATIAVVILLIILFFMVRKRTHKSPQPAIKAKENKPAINPQPAIKPQLDTESKKQPLPQANEPLRTARSDSKPAVAPKTPETVVFSSTDSNENLPQDSMLRRHYVANLSVMIKSLIPPRPTDSTLSRHYDSLITAEIEQCLNNKGAVEQLISKYEASKKLAGPLSQPEVSNVSSAAQFKNLKLPEDSVLRRHTLTHLKAIAEASK